MRIETLITIPACAQAFACSARLLKSCGRFFQEAKALRPLNFYQISDSSAHLLSISSPPKSAEDPPSLRYTRARYHSLKKSLAYLQEADLVHIRRLSETSSAGSFRASLAFSIFSGHQGENSFINYRTSRLMQARPVCFKTNSVERRIIGG